ncbi:MULTISPECIES: penicillin-binding protein 2 [unclassified Leptolyngbya]|uniref:penicillin-binding protein 2 n=1 Tax=unclassified Leptolyngbya TaxID=2650499 RepID=UPI0016822358|nr:MULTISPECIES: penicillin-binding protein 2 [unclassified Leptolyngbya]MBD1912978.1 penicillin-binding protein 2 [Leptolyngbya sp. FACHB-8]MBD2155711.1 penicillin-binding protein 2 [Leptolyngbya sp. FACHB-16]
MTLTKNGLLGQRDSTRTVGQRYQSVVVMFFITLALLGGIGSRLAYLQLVQGEQNRQLADNNRIRLIPRQPERGRILDRKGRTLAGSRLSFAVFLWPIANKEAEWKPIVQKVSKILNIPPKVIEDRLTQAGYHSPTLVRIARGISPAQVTALAELSPELNGVQVEGEAVRYYPNGDLGAHVLGYTGELTDDELKDNLDKGYRLGDVIGQMGVESSFEPRLRGEWGGQQVEVDGAGRVLRVLGEKSARAGNTVTLTLDLDVQRAAEAALGDRKGAVIAIDPRNGAVLAMVSRPTFDPNIFSGRVTDDQWQELQEKQYPFVNRTLQGFPPASTFKIVTTTAAIESGSFSPTAVLPTYPFVSVGGIQFWDWNRAGFGPLNFPGAMAMSSDTFFYQTAMRMGGETLIEWTRRYGFGSKTGIELSDEEAAGLVPDEAWKQENIGEGWFIGDSINMSIGQGFMQASPLQVARMFAVPANGGYLVKPHLLKDNEEAKQWRESLNISPTTVRVLEQGLRRVVTAGTGKVLNVPDLPPIAGKSGTAEDPPRHSHAWFGAYAPFDKPEIVVVAFVENSAAGGGGKVAGPIVLQVLQTYFGKAKSTANQPAN